MTNTNNYNLILVEGTDKYNPLTQVNPNFEKIDKAMKDNADSAISLATEIKSGTVHAITRSNPDAVMFRFVATSVWTTGDTIEVDSVQVSTLKTDGTPLETGDYVIGSNVIGLLTGTTLTLLVNAKSGDASTLDGHAASYFATADDLEGVSTVAEGAAKATADNKLAINQLNNYLSNNCIIGDVLSISVNWNKTGWTSANNINNYINTELIPSIDRYELAGFIVCGIQTYRTCSPYVVNDGVGFVCHFYAIDISITSTTIAVRPIYKKV